MHKYIVVVMAAMFITGCINTDESMNEIEAEEYAVYRAIINDEFETPVIVIAVVDHTVCESFPEKEFSKVLPHIYENMPAAHQETFDDFLVKNDQPYLLKHDFKIRGKIFLVSEEKLQKIFEGYFGRLKFYMRCPFSQGIMTFSRVGFNNGMDQALVYFENHRVLSSGSGYYVLLTKKDGVWTIENRKLIYTII